MAAVANTAVSLFKLAWSVGGVSALTLLGIMSSWCSTCRSGTLLLSAVLCKLMVFRQASVHCAFLKIGNFHNSAVSSSNITDYYHEKLVNLILQYDLLFLSRNQCSDSQGYTLHFNDRRLTDYLLVDGEYEVASGRHFIFNSTTLKLIHCFGKEDTNIVNTITCLFQIRDHPPPNHEFLAVGSSFRSMKVNPRLIWDSLHGIIKQFQNNTPQYSAILMGYLNPRRLKGIYDHNVIKSGKTIFESDYPPVQCDKYKLPSDIIISYGIMSEAVVFGRSSTPIIPFRRTTRCPTYIILDTKLLGGDTEKEEVNAIYSRHTSFHSPAQSHPNSYISNQPASSVPAWSFNSYPQPSPYLLQNTLWYSGPSTSLVPSGQYPAHSYTPSTSHLTQKPAVVQTMPYSVNTAVNFWPGNHQVIRPIPQKAYSSYTIQQGPSGCGLHPSAFTYDGTSQQYPSFPSSLSDLGRAGYGHRPPQWSP